MVEKFQILLKKFPMELIQIANIIILSKNAQIM